MCRSYLIFILIFLSCICYMPVHAFDDQLTHPKLTKQSIISNDSINTLLVGFIGYSSGFSKVLKGVNSNGVNKELKVIEWLQEGALDEDHPLCRATNHFHNPIHSGDWTQSKMSDSIIVPIYSFLVNCGTKYSNVTWATGFTSLNTGFIYRDGQDMGWDYARTYLHWALTSNDPTVREENFVKTFRSVGMVVHLLQDMAVPAHVRNDMQSHLLNGLNSSKWGSNPFEKYVGTHTNAISDTPVQPLFPGIARLTDFWDTDTYNGDNPSDRIDQGLAEYANANFLSDFSIFRPESDKNHYFKYPSKETSVEKVHYTIPDPINTGRTITRTYYQKTGDGDTGYRLAGVAFLNRWSFSMAPLKQISPMDDHVHDDYAKKILPRAVGYSAALLDYFFRGTVNITTTPGDISFRSVKVTATNTTANETMGTGEARLVIRYKELSENQLSGKKYLLNNPSADFTYKVSAPLTVDLTTPQQLTFDFSNDTLPYFFDDMTTQLVFKGKLGNEEGAVAVSKLEPVTGIYSDFDITLPASGVYAKTSDPSSSGTFGEIKVNAQADIAGGLSGGAFKLVLEYSEATTDPFQSLPVETNPVDAAGYVIRVNEKNGVSSLQPGQPAELVFDLSTVPLPVWATDVYMNIIYENESTSKPMAVAFHDISEPTPVEIFNNTDKSCIKGQWYESGSAAALAAVDDNNNSLADENDIYVHSLTNIYARMSSPGNPMPASAGTFNLQDPGPVLANALPKRLGYILTDYVFKYSVLETWVHTDPNDTWVRTEIPAMYPGTAIKNQVTSGTYTYPGMYVMRGEKMWWGSSVIYDNPPYPPGQSADISCGWGNLQ